MTDDTHKIIRSEVFLSDEVIKQLNKRIDGIYTSCLPRLNGLDDDLINFEKEIDKLNKQVKNLTSKLECRACDSSSLSLALSFLSLGFVLWECFFR